MADSKDLELGDEDPSSGSSSQSVRKNIAIKLNKSPSKSTRGRGKRGRAAKKATKKVEDDNPEQDNTAEKTAEEVDDMDILEEVQFASRKMTGSSSQEPLHKERKLNWDHKVNLIGEKVVDPLIHCCGKCGLPILIYGRMIPCKHVFCFDCAKQTEKNCPRPGCGDPVTRIEQSALGTVFICTFGGTKHGVNGCQRTYLSQRDLQAHISHRHMRNQSSHSSSSHSSDSRQPPQSSQQDYMRNTVSLSTSQTPSVALQSSGGMHDQSMNLFHQPPPTLHSGQLQHPPPQSAPPPLGHIPPQTQTHPPPQAPPPVGLSQTLQPPPQNHLPPPPVTSHIESYHTIPVMSSSRTNLITVPIQDESDYRRRDSGYSSQPPANPSYPPPAAPPPSHFPPNTSHPPPQVSYASGPPPYSSSGPPPHHGPPPMAGPPPMSNAPPPHGAPPPVPRGPSVSGHVPPIFHYEEYNTGSPRPHWPQSGPPRGPPPRPPAANPSMGPPPRPYNYQ